MNPFLFLDTHQPSKREPRTTTLIERSADGSKREVTLQWTINGWTAIASKEIEP